MRDPGIAGKQLLHCKQARERASDRGELERWRSDSIDPCTHTHEQQPAVAVAATVGVLVAVAAAAVAAAVSHP